MGGLTVNLVLVDPIFQIYFSWVKISLHIEFQPSRLPRSDRFIQSLNLFKAGVGWVEISFHVEFHPPGLPRSGKFMVGHQKKSIE